MEVVKDAMLVAVFVILAGLGGLLWVNVTVEFMRMKDTWFRRRK